MKSRVVSQILTEVVRPERRGSLWLLREEGARKGEALEGKGLKRMDSSESPSLEAQLREPLPGGSANHGCHSAPQARCILRASLSEPAPCCCKPESRAPTLPASELLDVPVTTAGLGSSCQTFRVRSIRCSKGIKLSHGGSVRETTENSVDVRNTQTFEIFL